MNCVCICIFCCCCPVALTPPVKWYMVLVAFIMGPFIALPNSYGAGLTDQVCRWCLAVKRRKEQNGG